MNRLDDIILFDGLKEEHVIEIAELELNKLINRMADQGYKIKVNKTAKVFLAQKGYDPLYGARPLKRAIQNYVEDILADAIINKEIEEGSKTYTISHKSGEDKLSLK